MSRTKKARSRRRESQILDRYLKDVNTIPLLSPKEEAILSQRIKGGNQEALQKLVKANLRFVVSVAKQYQNQGMPLLDLINEGNIGLIEAAKRFDGTKGYKFISYAVWWIRQAILKALAEQSRIVRLPLNRISELCRIVKHSRHLEQRLQRVPMIREVVEGLGIAEEEATEIIKISSLPTPLDAPLEGEDDRSLLHILPNEKQPPPDKETIDKSLVRELKRILGTLAPREAEIIKLYYGLEGARPHTLEEIGRKFGLSRERARQIKKKALIKLRHVSRSSSLRPYMS
jgi:RNA polymerase primary sigma factor